MNDKMSTNSPQSESAQISDAELSERDEILTRLAEQISFVDERIAGLKAASDPNEAMLIRWVRTQGYVAGQYRKLMKDVDISEMQEDLELLKEVANVEGDRR